MDASDHAYCSNPMILAATMLLGLLAWSALEPRQNNVYNLINCRPFCDSEIFVDFRSVQGGEATRQCSQSESSPRSMMSFFRNPCIESLAGSTGGLTPIRSCARTCRRTGQRYFQTHGTTYFTTPGILLESPLYDR